MGDVPPRVLVVDPSEDNAESLSLLLRLWGYEARSAPDGPSALDVVPAYRPDVVVMEVALPRLNGWEVARRLRRQEGRPVLLVGLTVCGRGQDRVNSREAGFDHHLVKPADPGELRCLLAEYVPLRGPSPVIAG